MRALLTALIFLTFGAPAAVAQGTEAPLAVPLNTKDPEDGTAIRGVRLASEDRQAFLFIWCDADNTNPRIIFTHGRDLDESTKPIGFDVTIDGVTFRHYFTVMKNTKAAMYFVRTAEMYHDRFGVSPEVFDPKTRAVNPLYIEWTDNIYNQVTDDLFFGERGRFDFTDGAGAAFSYTFPLLPLAGHIARLRDCYEAPRQF
jgi:hypothetical protein